MWRPGGYAVAVTPDGAKPIECDTFTCAHCNSVILLQKPSTDIGGFCRCCMRAVCSTCVGKGVCSPFMRRVEQAEQAQYRRNQLVKAGG